MNPHQTEVVTRTLDTGSFQGKQKKHFECHGTRGFVSKRDACVLEFRLCVLFFFVIFSCCVWCIWLGLVLQLKCRTFQNFYGNNRRDCEGRWWGKKALHSIIVMYIGSIHLIWIPKLRDFRCLCFDLRKMVANAECSRQDMVLLWRKMARGKGCSPASWKIRLLFGTCCYGGQGRLHVGVWPEDTASVSWSRVDWFTRCKKLMTQCHPETSTHSGSKGSWCVAV